MPEFLKHLPPLTTLKGFVTAARLESFSRAAEELHMPESGELIFAPADNDDTIRKR